jgi:hypothetical protein
MLVIVKIAGIGAKKYWTDGKKKIIAAMIAANIIVTATMRVVAVTGDNAESRCMDYEKYYVYMQKAAELFRILRCVSGIFLGNPRNFRNDILSFACRSRSGSKNPYID